MSVLIVVAVVVLALVSAWYHHRRKNLRWFQFPLLNNEYMEVGLPEASGGSSSVQISTNRLQGLSRQQQAELETLFNRYSRRMLEADDLQTLSVELVPAIYEIVYAHTDDYEHFKDKIRLSARVDMLANASPRLAFSFLERHTADPETLNDMVRQLLASSRRVGDVIWLIERQKGRELGECLDIVIWTRLLSLDHEFIMAVMDAVKPPEDSFTSLLGECVWRHWQGRDDEVRELIDDKLKPGGDESPWLVDNIRLNVLMVRLMQNRQDDIEAILTLMLDADSSVLQHQAAIGALAEAGLLLGRADIVWRCCMQAEDQHAAEVLLDRLIVHQGSLRWIERVMQTLSKHQLDMTFFRLILLRMMHQDDLSRLSAFLQMLPVEIRSDAIIVAVEHYATLGQSETMDSLLELLEGDALSFAEAILPLWLQIESNHPDMATHLWGQVEQRLAGLNRSRAGEIEFLCKTHELFALLKRDCSADVIARVRSLTDELLQIYENPSSERALYTEIFVAGALNRIGDERGALLVRQVREKLLQNTEELDSATRLTFVYQLLVFLVSANDIETTEEILVQVENEADGLLHGQGLAGLICKFIEVDALESAIRYISLPMVHSRPHVLERLYQAIADLDDELRAQELSRKLDEKLDDEASWSLLKTPLDEAA